MKKGIDLSCWQENVDYNKLKEQGIEFAIIRDGYGKNKTQKDKMFEKHYEGLKKAGIKVGAYHYSYFTSIEGAKKEAKMCLEFIIDKSFELPVFIDVEENRIIGQVKENITQGIIEFCKIIENAGYKAGVYANLNWFTTYIDVQKIIDCGYAIWLAQWNSKITANFKVDYWQYTSKGKLEGISGNVDLNYQIKAVDTVDKPVDNKKSIEELAQEVIDGKWGNGQERYDRLTEAGYDYNKVQTKVNEILGFTKKLYYMVKFGDTLSRISKKFNVSIETLCKWNNIKDPNKIYAGSLMRVK